MAKFRYICKANPEHERVLKAYKKPSFAVKCKECDSDMQSKISGGSTIIKGAAESNNYYVPPSNADIGLESEYSILKKSTQKATEYLDSESREEKRDFDREKLKRAKERHRNIERLKKKNPEFYNKFQEGLSKIKKNMKSKMDKNR